MLENRKKLFGFISDLPTLYDVVMERKPVKGVNHTNKTKSSAGSKSVYILQRESHPYGVNLNENNSPNLLCLLFL